MLSLPAPRTVALLPPPLVPAPHFVGQDRLWVTTTAGTFSVDPQRLGEALAWIAGLSIPTQVELPLIA